MIRASMDEKVRLPGDLGKQANMETWKGVGEILSKFTGAGKNVAETVGSVLKSVETAKGLQKKTLPDVVRKGALVIGGGALLGAGAHASSDAYERIRSALTADSGYKKMLKENPDLATLPEAEVRRVFDVVHDFSPELSNTPLVAGSVVRRAMEYKGVGIAPNTIKEMLDVSRGVQDLKGNKSRMGGTLRELGLLGTQIGAKGD